MKKIVTIVGARPQFIKAAAISRAAKDFPVNEILVHTGQHFDNNMSEIFFKEMDIPEPDYNLNINSLSHGEMTGKMLESIEKVLMKEKPDLVIVYGDTNSTLAGALAAKKIGVEVAHIEAGLRSFNMSMPEEINRILTDRISDYLFCPTQTAVNNLEKEGFQNFNCLIENVGDVMYDAALFYEKKSDAESTILEKLGIDNKKYVLCTVHRQENTDDTEKISSILSALNEINKDIQVILPLHPRTKKIIRQRNIELDFSPIDPVGYFDIIKLIKHSRFVMTDSGGMQKEAYFFNKFCLTMREETEWIELVEHGVNFLVGARKESILDTMKQLPDSFSEAQDLYGKGNASHKILQRLTG